MKRNKQQGFTMLELLIVILILGTIYVIAVPQYVSYREKSQKRAIISECRSLYRAFVIFYLEHEEYPYATEGEFLFNKETLFPLTNKSAMGGASFDIDIDTFLKKFDGAKAEKFESPDDMGTNQEFYLILPWVGDPNVKFVISASDNIEYADGTSVDGGNWLDGVFITEGGAIH